MKNLAIEKGNGGKNIIPINKCLKNGTLTERLEVLFRGCPLEDVNSAIENAKIKVFGKLDDVFVKLFNSQMMALQQKKCPRNIIFIFEGMRDEVIHKAENMEYQSAFLPFIPVIPSAVLNIESLLEMAYGKYSLGGGTNLSFANIDKDISSEPYFIFNVNGGTALRKELPDQAEKIIKETNRFCMTLDESVALHLHSNISSLHCVGSRSTKLGNNYLPTILNTNSGVMISISAMDDDSDNCSKPSCVR